MNNYEESLQLHKTLRGKITVRNKMDVRTNEDLSKVYSPGVAAPCEAIAADKNKVYDYTLKGNCVAIVTDGSAVLGLGNIGPEAAMPVMEGKAMLFKKFGDIDAFPICLNTQDTEEIIRTVKYLAPTFGGINLEDIAAPHCFEIERRLQDIGIPVFHDDQDGTAIVVLAGLINAAKLVGKSLFQLKVVVNGAGAAGTAITRLLRCQGFGDDKEACVSVKDVIACDSKGIVSKDRTDLNEEKIHLLEYTNTNNVSGTLQDALKGADVFIGVSKGNLLTADDIRLMAKDAIIFALANPTPEIMPDEAFKGGAAIVGTGRSDLPNQINNVLGFPGIFRGALDARAPRITPAMKLAAAHAIADHLRNPTREQIIPATLDPAVAHHVAEAVRAAAGI
ncbi:NAD(P)-dependent malic enzyme [Phnomibacter ginsenosidimutans]|uniref:NAD-dependent malic enzyme n=1 Tax=Phnomibacter ginsenosidimutans TaxID=2676868 RepID=A0A6I6GYS5_9BACT|nr:NADP-dependent malic enzyme [Phnomibacter ginsenosidimutans]QGW27681.1 NAD-dependent malic enzyme [Phnomibacter ginsenosidimutans]